MNMEDSTFIHFLQSDHGTLYQYGSISPFVTCQLIFRFRIIIWINGHIDHLT